MKKAHSWGIRDEKDENGAANVEYLCEVEDEVILSDCGTVYKPMRGDTGSDPPHARDVQPFNIQTDALKNCDALF